MYPVTDVEMPEAFNKLEIPKLLQLDPKDIMITKMHE